jgi:UDP-N-acetylmuramyl tripeptide synthase
MELLDSRRLTGPNILSDRAGAIIDVRLDADESDRFIAAWRKHVNLMLERVGWGGLPLHVRRMSGGVSLGFDAPIDVLYAATEINDWAYEAARRQLAEEEPGPLDEDASRLRQLIDKERNPSLIALRNSADQRGVPFLSDDDHASVGFGVNSLTWAVDSLPGPDDVPWEQIGTIPVGLVTGTNGKTTTVRLAEAMIAAAGGVTGLSSTDRIVVGGRTVDEGDYAGPGGAREVLRHREVETAVLETARGGLLRRGAGMQRADAAVLTNIAADHLDDFGVRDLEALADVKWIVTRVLGKTGVAIINAEDPLLVRRAAKLECPVTWFSLDPAAPAIANAPRRAFVLDGGQFVLIEGEKWTALIGAEEVPVTLGGSARHNIANCLAAIALADALGVPMDAILSALRSTTHAANPGRGNLFDIGGAKVLVDFAHNPHGIEALGSVAEHFGKRRRLLLIGQAGDRGDEAIRQLAQAAWKLRPDRIVIKEMARYSRGRDEREVACLLTRYFVEAGADPDSIGYQAEEIDGVREALNWVEPGDLAVVLVHEDIDGLVEYVRAASEA